MAVWHVLMGNILQAEGNGEMTEEGPGTIHDSWLSMCQFWILVFELLGLLGILSGQQLHIQEQRRDGDRTILHFPVKFSGCCPENFMVTHQKIRRAGGSASLDKRPSLKRGGTLKRGGSLKRRGSKEEKADDKVRCHSFSVYFWLFWVMSLTICPRPIVIHYSTATKHGSRFVRIQAVCCVEQVASMSFQLFPSKPQQTDPKNHHFLCLKAAN